MKRLCDNLLKNWKKDPIRKPLVIRGARQVGKTTAIRHFSKQFTSFVEVNFEQLPNIASLFQQDLKPERIVRELQLALNVEIIPDETLLFFDEIQMCPQAIISLRYFYEQLPKLHVIAAGSLLDFAIEQVGLPVGRISFLYIQPMSFIEFLWAMDQTRLANQIIHHAPTEPLNEIAHVAATKLLGEYMAIGGMPEAVSVWRDSKNYKSCLAIHKDILLTYQEDFEKYARTAQIKYVKKIFSECSHQVGQQFTYAQVDGAYRTRELSPALELLIKANIIHTVTHTSAQGIPLAAQSNLKRFKLIMLDVGLMQSLLGVTAEDWMLNPRPTFSNKGAIAEAFVGQEILAYSQLRHSYQLYYWENTKKSSIAEIDYLTMNEERKIIPVEVKSGNATRLKSLWKFLEGHPDSPYGIRYAMDNYAVGNQGRLHNYPLYAVAGVHWPDLA